MAILVIVFLLLSDIITKQWALRYLAVEGDITVIEGFFKLSYLENRGAAFGILQNKQIFLIIITSIIILGMLYYVFILKPKSRLLNWSLYLIIAGAVGNLIDRNFLGFVVDFLEFHYKSYYFPTFNLADTFVVIGTGPLIIYVLKGE